MNMFILYKHEICKNHLTYGKRYKLNNYVIKNH